LPKSQQTLVKINLLFFSYKKQTFLINKIDYGLTKLFGLQWQGAPFKDVSREYRVRFPGGTTFGQCVCIYA